MTSNALLSECLRKSDEQKNCDWVKSFFFVTRCKHFTAIVHCILRVARTKNQQIKTRWSRSCDKFECNVENIQQRIVASLDISSVRKRQCEQLKRNRQLYMHVQCILDYTYWCISFCHVHFYILLLLCVIRTKSLGAWSTNDTNRFFEFLFAESRTWDTIAGCSFFTCSLCVYGLCSPTFSVQKNPWPNANWLQSKRGEVSTNRAMNSNFIWFCEMSMECFSLCLAICRKKIAFSIRIFIHRF